jgi:hypothetical protein
VYVPVAGAVAPQGEGATPYLTMPYDVRSDPCPRSGSAQGRLGDDT